MATSFRTHLTVVKKWVEKTPTAPAFRVPQWSEGGEFSGWKPVTFAEFWEDIENTARYFSSEFAQKGLKERDTVGIWSAGLSYTDVVHIWGLARAGFVPLLISRRISHLGAIGLLLKGGEAKGLVYAGPKPELDAISVAAPDIKALNVDGLPLPELYIPSNEDEIVLKFHSSGSSSGMPKVIPMTARWVDFLFDKLGFILASDPNSDKQETISVNGSIVHLSGTMVIIGSHFHGHCIVICKEVTSSPEELKTLTKEHGLTRIFMFSTFLAKLMLQSRDDPDLLQALQGLSMAIHGGVPMEIELGKWAQSQGIKLVDVFGSTEIGTAMTSGSEGPGPNAAYLKALPGTKYKFVSIDDASASEDAPKGPKLFEMIVTAESGDCPHPSLRNKETGDFHTGDLLEEVAPGYYLSKGRNDDWIKMQNACRCDTQSIEDNAKEVCGKDLISAVVCIGAGRPSPALVVEPLVDGEVPSTLNQTILERITPFHERMYAHERVQDARLIFIAPKGSLPKTPKGNVQRNPVEKTYEKALDEFFAETKA